MAMLFSSKNIPELAGLSLQERHVKLTQAQQKFSVPEKLVLNIVKLLMLIPPFLMLARQEWGYFALALLGAIALKMLVFTPLQLSFCRKYLAN